MAVLPTRTCIPLVICAVASACATTAAPQQAFVLEDPSPQTATERVGGTAVEASKEPSAQPPIVTASGGLKFLVEPTTAELLVNGLSYGAVSELVTSEGVLRLNPGLYQVSLRHPGFVTWRAEVAVDSAEQPLQVTLVPKQ